MTGGAGKGSFNTENKIPTNTPVANANKTSAIVIAPLLFLFTVSLIKIFYC